MISLEKGPASWLIGIFIFTSIFYAYIVFVWDPSEKEKVAATTVSTDNFFKKMEAELETTKNGDILETRWVGEGEGSRTLWVVTQDSKEGRVYYQVKGGSANLRSSSELAQRVVKIYRVGTPEWREKAEKFMKQ